MTPVLRRLAALTLTGALSASCLAALAAPASQGLIVRLKDAPSHERLQSRASGAADTQALEATRWRRVLRDSGLREGGPALRPVGRDQQWLDFGRRLSAEETVRWAERLRQRPDVAWVEPNTRERRLQAAPPSDPDFAAQWWLQPVSGSNGNVQADRLRGVAGFLSAWQSGVPGATAGVTVAVLDSGLTAHPDIGGRTLPGYDFVSETVYANDGNGRDADPSDPGDWVDSNDLLDANFEGCTVENSSWHGTINTGLLAATVDNGQGGAGIQRTARVLPVRVAGKCGATLGDIVDGMRWAGGLRVDGVPDNPNPARVLNISFGGSAACGPTYQAAIDELHAIGVVVVAAAGNEWGAVTRPASCRGVVGVAALNRDGYKTNYSNFGAELSASGLATVGGDDAGGAWGTAVTDGGLYTVWNFGLTGPGDAGYAGVFGTSFSAPLVAGAVSLMLGVNPALNVDQVIAGLRLSARPHVTSTVIAACSSANPGRCICTTATCGAGILDAAQALLYAASPGSYVAPVRQPVTIDNTEVRAAAALGADRIGEAPPPPEPVADGGGGAFGVGWGAALAAAALALSARRRR